MVVGCELAGAEDEGGGERHEAERDRDTNETRTQRKSLC